MIEKHLDIATADGAMNSFVVYPEEGGPHPVVLFYMDAPGKREELHDMARRLASVGYYVVLPNLYYRKAREFVLERRDEAGMAAMFALMNHLTNALVVRDTEAMLRFVDAQPEADGKRVGAVGYCMSGPFVMAAAAAFPDRIKAIASIHGANLVTDREDSAHLMAPRIRCESYFACAETDKWAPREIVDKLAKAISDTLDAPATQARLRSLAVVPPTSERRTPAYLQTFIESEIEKWAIVIKASGVKLD